MIENAVKKSQNVICNILNFIYKYTNRINDEARNVGLMITFLMLSVCSYIYFVFPIYVHLFYKCLIGTVVMMFMIIFSISREVKPQPWDKKIVVLWFGFGVIRLLSGVITSKEYLPLACIWLVGFPTLFLIWTNRKEYSLMLESMYKGFLYPTILFMFLSILIVPIQNEAYTGITNNANAIGLQMAVVLPICCWKCLVATEKKEKLINFVLLSTIISFAFFSRSRTITLVIVGVIVCGASLLGVIKKDIGRSLKFVFTVVCISFITCCFLVQINKISNSIIDWKFEGFETKDMDTSSLVDGYMNRMSGEDKHDGGLDNYSSGRIGIWQKTIDELNLFGHPSREHIITTRNGDVGNNTHNVYLQFAYDHGILGGIIFGLLCLVSLLDAMYLCFNKENCELYLCVVLIHVVYIGVSMFTSVNLPFLYTISFVYYMTYGILLEKRK